MEKACVLLPDIRKSSKTPSRNKLVPNKTIQRNLYQIKLDNLLEQMRSLNL